MKKERVKPFFFIIKSHSTRTWVGHLTKNVVFFLCKTVPRAPTRINNVEKLCYALDEIRKKWYYSSMDNNIEINQKIAKNLINYRKAAGLTQAEVAEKIHYSDKSVSKWESGNGVPDVYTLIQLAKLYGVSINAFLGEETDVRQVTKSRWLHVLIMLLSSGIVWLVAILCFVTLQLVKPGFSWWLIYLYAVLVNGIVILVYAALWKHRILNFLSVTAIIWVSLVCIFLTVRALALIYGFEYDGLWCIFLLGVPLQILEILWAFFRTLLRKQRGMVVVKTESKAEPKTETKEEEN